MAVIDPCCLATLSDRGFSHGSRRLALLAAAAIAVLSSWFVASPAANAEAEPPIYASAFSGMGEALDIAIDESGDLWVASYSKHQVREYNAKGELLSQFGSFGSKDGQFNSPAGIAIDGEGHLWVSDKGNNRVQEFNQKGEYLSKFGAGYLTSPSGIDIDSEGDIWVASWQTESIISEFNDENEFLGSFGKTGSGTGQLKGVFLGIAIDAEDNLFIAEYENHRVQQFNSAGESLRQFSEKGTGEGQLEFPYGISLDAEGNVWVMDGHRGEVFTNEGEYLFEFGEKGAGEGQFDRALAIELHPNGNVWIGDLANFRVQRWQLPTTAYKLEKMAVTQPFDGSMASLNDFSTNWTALGWAGGGTPKGAVAATGWHPVNAYPTVNGAFYSPTFTDTGPGIADVVTMATNPANVGRYFSIWLDMSSPSGVRNGYELRLANTAAGLYTATLAKWQEGEQTALDSQANLALANGNSVALVDQGSSVSAWADTGSGFVQILGATDSSFSSGKSGVEGAGNITRLKDFKVGSL